MCGIAGMVGRVAMEVLSAMADALSHRGPDGAGFWRDEDADVGLAHRRLAIIDLSNSAAQPMAGVNGRYQVVFNGEIYNFRALAGELRGRGYVFNPNSDTAVLAPLYDAYGPAMLAKLNGLFAFAIWDAKERVLFAARDHIGAKPFYYTRQIGRFAFASELKALSVLPDLDRTVDESAILDYLEKLWSPGEGTPFRSVRKLPPGHWIRVEGAAVTVSSWSSAVGAAPAIPSTQAAAKHALLSLFDNIVADQCVSDVPVGAFLSGGVDSTAIVASMMSTGHRPARTYCIGFEGAGMEEEGFGEDLAYARIAADALGAPLTSMKMRPPDAEDLVRLAVMLDEPQADPAPLYVAAISEAARADGVTVLLSGAGGDDIFSGYRRHVAAALRDALGPMKLCASLVPDFPRSSAIGRRLGLLKELMGGDDDAFLLRSSAFNPPELSRACLSPAVRAAAMARPNSFWRAAVMEKRGEALLPRILRLERFGFLPDHNLNYTDKASMAHGVEVRVPFLDPRLIAFADALPLSWKVRGLEPKWLLKRALAQRLPRAIIARRKTGFGGPVRSWINGPLAPALRDVLASSAFRQRGLFDPEGVERVRAATAAGTVDGAYLLLAVMVVEFWFQEFAKGPFFRPV